MSTQFLGKLGVSVSRYCGGFRLDSDDRTRYQVTTSHREILQGLTTEQAKELISLLQQATEGQ